MALECVICKAALAKRDAQFVGEETFEFQRARPEDLALGAYCHACFESSVQPALTAYEDKLERARDVNVFMLSQSKESRFVRRTEKPVHAEDCADREEVILRLAFQAVEAGKNSLVDVECNSTKVMNGKWKSSRWSGRGIPAHIDERQLQRKTPGTPN